MTRRPPRSPLFPYSTLFRSIGRQQSDCILALGSVLGDLGPTLDGLAGEHARARRDGGSLSHAGPVSQGATLQRSEEHTSELQSRQYLVCRLLLEKKK